MTGRRVPPCSPGVCSCNQPILLRSWLLSQHRLGSGCRYEDDTCCVIRQGEVDKLLHHLNNIRPARAGGGWVSPPPWYQDSKISLSNTYEEGYGKVTAPGALDKEEDHLMKVLMGNGYLHCFISSASAARALREDDRKREEERSPTACLSYVAGISERVCKDFNI